MEFLYPITMISSLIDRKLYHTNSSQSNYKTKGCCVICRDEETLKITTERKNLFLSSEQMAAHLVIPTRIDTSIGRKEFYQAKNYALNGKYLEAMKLFKYVIPLRPDAASPHYHLGLVFIELDRLDQAVFHFKQANNIKPDVIKYKQLYESYLNLSKSDKTKLNISNNCRHQPNVNYHSPCIELNAHRLAAVSGALLSLKNRYIHNKQRLVVAIWCKKPETAQELKKEKTKRTGLDIRLFQRDEKMLHQTTINVFILHGSKIGSDITFIQNEVNVIIVYEAKIRKNIYSNVINKVLIRHNGKIVKFLSEIKELDLNIVQNEAMQWMNQFVV